MDGIILNRLSKYIEELNNFVSKARNLNEINDENLEETKILAAKLKAILSRFTAELYQYFNLSKDPDPDTISSFTTDQLQGEEILAELEARLKLKIEQNSVPLKSDQASYSKLPDLHLPEFSGNVLDWHQFWDQFISKMNRRKLNDVDKLLYLKSSLKGDAARLIDGFDTTNQSYQIAVNTLKARYGKNDEIIYAHHNALRKINRAERMEECKGILDELERHLRVLQAMGENTNSNQMRFLIMEKFPTEIIYEMKMRLDTGKTESVEDILNQLSRVISVKEEARMITQDNNPQYTVETLHIKDEAKHTGRSSSIRNNSNLPKQPRNNRNNARSKFNKWKPREGNLPLKRRFDHNLRKERNETFGFEKRRKLSCSFCNENHLNKDCNTNLYKKKASLKNKCYNCFREGHYARDCRFKKKCEFCSKYGWHDSALCIRNPRNFKSDGKDSGNLDTKDRIPVNTNVMHTKSSRRNSIALQTAVVKVKNNDGTVRKCRILLDSGSQRSYITQKMARELNLQTEEHNNLAIFTFGSQCPKEILSPLVRLDVMVQDETTKTLFVNVVPSISQGVPCPEKGLLQGIVDKKYRLADDGSLADRIDILLGNDYYYTIMSTKKICIGEDLYLVQSKFGWILSGRISNEPFEQLSVLTYFQSGCEIGLNQPDPPLDNNILKNLWDLESIGITDSPKINRDEEALKHFNDTTEFHNKRYYVSWPWNDLQSKLPSNFGLAFGRLVNLLKRLDSDTLKSYEQTLKDQLEKGVIEEVPKMKESDENHLIHYIPHHGVSVPGKSLRIVYDASAKTKDNKSLNEHLYRGPILLEDLTGLIIKFRSYTVGLTADVEKAFLQIGLKERDRDVTRFLWVKDVKEPAKDDNLIHYRFARVPFGVISSPFLLNATVKHHLAKTGNSKVQGLAKDIYVDNLVTGCNDVSEALDLYRNSKKTYQEISMNLRQWSSNSKEFMNQIPEVDACYDKTIKILGLNWNVENDTLHLRTKVVKGADTKRGVLKVIASIYDPCGYVVPYVLSAKLFLQELWKDKAKWDTPLPKDLVDKWTSICDELNEVKELSLNRRYMKYEEDKEYQLHCFTDASQKAYAASIFLVSETERSFVIGKSRLVPIKDRKSFTIPRLELLGVLIGSRLLKYTLKFLPHKISKQVLWSDSQIVIEWCKTDKLLSPFITRRVEEIKENKLCEIRYVPSTLNPADVGTRPFLSKEEKEKWLVGPQFLVENSDMWPLSCSALETTVFSAGEDLTKTENIESTKMEVTKSVPDVVRDQAEKPGVSSAESTLGDNTLEEVKKVQAEYFKEEVNGKVTSLSRNLGLFKDIDGVLRCKGRLKYAEWSFDKRYPIIVPTECEFTENIIKTTHEKNYHVGVNHTLSIIRQTFWIPKGKRQVCKILKKCVQCVKHGGGPFKLPPTPALPHERVNYSKPYTFTGIDYLGPVLVKTAAGTEKRWICLYTCLAVRAIHLEVVQDLSAEEGLLALRRMISVRGTPMLITSDNALYFKLMSDIVANKYCVENKIKWRFIPELAPWFGGFYERLVGLVKHCMRRTFQKHLLNDGQLLTMIKEIEAVINTRPLTAVDAELEHILTPADFLYTGRCLVMETSKDNILAQGTSTKINLIEGWRRARIILDEFKEMFSNRYLPSLRERYSHSHKQPRVTSVLIPKEGQLVQIKGDKNRESWKVGKIVSLVKGSDGLVRVAQVKVGNTVFTRSIGHLYPLELDKLEDQGPKCLDSRRDEEEPLNEIPRFELMSVDKPDGSDKPKEDIISEIRSDYNETSDSAGVIEDVVNVRQEEPDSEIAEPLDKVDGVNEDVQTLDVEMLPVGSESEARPIESKVKRAAAVRALERIREWTHNLAISLL